MHARKTAALAIIAGLATVGSLAGTAGSAFAAPTRTAPNSSIKTNTDAPLPKVAQKSSDVAKTDLKSRNATKGSVKAAASYRDCYVYSNGTGDLCNYWNWNLGGSRGGTYVADGYWGDNYFVTPRSGQYQSWDNNSYSTANYDHYWSARVYTGYNGSGYWKRIWQYTGQNNTGVFLGTLSSNYWN